MNVTGPILDKVADSDKGKMPNIKVFSGKFFLKAFQFFVVSFHPALVIFRVVASRLDPKAL